MTAKLLANRVRRTYLGGGRIDAFTGWSRLSAAMGNREEGTGNGWVDVAAEGVTPVDGEEYTLRTTFDYTANTYSVEIKINDVWLPLNSSTPNSSTPNFRPLTHS